MARVIRRVEPVWTPALETALAKALKATGKPPRVFPARGAAQIREAVEKAEKAARANGGVQTRKGIEAYFNVYSSSLNLAHVGITWVPTMPVDEILVEPDPTYCLDLV